MKLGAYFDVAEYLPPQGQMVVGIERLEGEGFDADFTYPCVCWTVTDGSWRTMDVVHGKARRANIVRWSPLPSQFVDGLSPDLILLRPDQFGGDHA